MMCFLLSVYLFVCLLVFFAFLFFVEVDFWCYINSCCRMVHLIFLLFLEDQIIIWFIDCLVEYCIYRSNNYSTTIYSKYSILLNQSTLLKSSNHAYRLIRLQNRLWKSVQCLEFFTSHEWGFEDYNVSNLFGKMSFEDQEVCGLCGFWGNGGKVCVGFCVFFISIFIIFSKF